MEEIEFQKLADLRWEKGYLYPFEKSGRWTAEGRIFPDITPKLPAGRPELLVVRPKYPGHRISPGQTSGTPPERFSEKDLAIFPGIVSKAGTSGPSEISGQTSGQKFRDPNREVSRI